MLLIGMSQPVKLSDALVLDAHIAGEAFERSLTGQVEFWARLGRAIEPLLQGTQVLALCRNATAQPLSACLESIDSAEGRKRVSEYLDAQPFASHSKRSARHDGLAVRSASPDCGDRGIVLDRVPFVLAVAFTS